MGQRQVKFRGLRSAGRVLAVAGAAVMVARAASIRRERTHAPRPRRDRDAGSLAGQRAAIRTQEALDHEPNAEWEPVPVPAPVREPLTEPEPDPKPDPEREPVAAPAAAIAPKASQQPQFSLVPPSPLAPAAHRRDANQPEAPRPPVDQETHRDRPRREMSWESLRAPLLVSLAIVIAAVALWYIWFHQRTDAQTVQDHVALKNPGSTIGCVESLANGSQWQCAIVFTAESDCLSVSVSVLGRISAGRSTPARCAMPALRRMLPDHVTRDMVSADVTRIVGGPPFLCAGTKRNSSRWGCARSTTSHTDCVMVRVAPWTRFRPKNEPKLCSTIPYLRQVVIG